MYFDLIINDVFGLILNSHMVVWSRIYTAQSTAPRHSTYFSFAQENQERNCKRITTTKITAKKINGQGKKNVATAAIAKQQKNSNHTHLSYSVRISVCVYMHINIHLTTKIWNKNGIKIRIIFSLWLLSCVFFFGYIFSLFLSLFVYVSCVDFFVVVRWWFLIEFSMDWAFLYPTEESSEHKMIFTTHKYKHTQRWQRQHWIENNNKKRSTAKTAPSIKSIAEAFYANTVALTMHELIENLFGYQHWISDGCTITETHTNKLSQKLESKLEK